MKLLRSIHTLNPAAGGPVESLRQSSAILARRGHEVEIATLDAPDAAWLRDGDFKVHALGTGRGGYGYSARFLQWLKTHRAGYDAVIVHGLWQYSSFGVWRALHGTGTPYFVFPHGMLDPWFNRTYPLKRVKKLLYWPWAEYRVLRDAAAVLFTSEEERRSARESFALYRCREVVVNYGTAAPAVDLAAAREIFLEHFPQLRGERVLLFLGRLHVKKGVELLLETFAEARDTSSLQLVIAGPCASDDYLRQLQKIAAENPRVTFVGMLEGMAKWGAFAAADAFVLPSHQENFGIAVAEALACGTPVLLSNKVNIWREIEADGAGFVENDDRAGTARLLARWLACAEPERARMRENARVSFAKRFEIERAATSLLEVLQTRAAA